MHLLFLTKICLRKKNTIKIKIQTTNDFQNLDFKHNLNK